ncbi:MAG: hypothetical protein K8E24_008265 [Methanobacterium paludis]|nr:hypothetical protein [Methanobacterium paludis]
MSKNFTAIKYCKWCGEPFEVKSPNQKYCSPDIKNEVVAFATKHSMPVVTVEDLVSYRKSMKTDAT